MADHTVLEAANGQARYKSNSGGLCFKMRTAGAQPQLTLLSHRDPNLYLYRLTFGYETKIYDVLAKKEETFTARCLPNFNEFRDYYLTWHGNKIKVGLVGQEAFVNFQKTCDKSLIGYIIFKPVCKNSQPVEWIIETSPVILKSLSCKMSGRPRWRLLRNGKLPPNAIIGGFENELIYIARAFHNHSMCPGKYVPSTGKAFVPWGHLECAKEEFEILCGLDAKWYKTQSNHIPQNAFIAGYSEVNNEPLYIGRAMIEGQLICGKVHVLYKVCFLPFRGHEIEEPMYEILVIPSDEIPQALLF